MATSATTLVRPARAGDPPSISAVQAQAWRLAYGNLLPEATLTALTPEALLPAWRRAVSEPPSSRHAVLVAVADDIVVGFAAVGPSEDRDAGETDGQLAVLAVDPLHVRNGHGSRLMSAVVDHLRNYGLTTLSVWIPERDLARHTFFTSAGMLADGARRSYAGANDEDVVEVRLSADIAPADDPTPASTEGIAAAESTGSAEGTAKSDPGDE
jgi:GNAT superfamily N-acetyltransferase